MARFHSYNTGSGGLKRLIHIVSWLGILFPITTHAFASGQDIAAIDPIDDDRHLITCHDGLQEVRSRLQVTNNDVCLPSLAIRVTHDTFLWSVDGVSPNCWVAEGVRFRIKSPSMPALGSRQRYALERDSLRGTECGLERFEVFDRSVTFQLVDGTRVSESKRAFDFYQLCSSLEQDRDIASTVLAIQKEVGEPDCVKSAISLESRVSLNLSSSGIRDLRPLQLMTQLEKLDLSFNQIIKADNLIHLSNLRSLDLYRNLIRDGAPLAQLSNLQELVLDGNYIEDISFVSSLPHLKVLSVGENPLMADAQLGADRCPVSTEVAHPMQGFCDLTVRDNLKAACLGSQGRRRLFYEVAMSSFRIPQCDALGEGLDMVTSLELSFQGWKTLDELKFLPYLETLNLSHNQLLELRNIRGLQKLWRLEAANNVIESIQGLQGMNSLLVLDLSNNFIDDVSSLSGLDRLRVLDLRNNRIADLSPIHRLPQLKSVLVSGNPDSDCSGFPQNIQCK